MKSYDKYLKDYIIESPKEKDMTNFLMDLFYDNINNFKNETNLKVFINHIIMFSKRIIDNERFGNLEYDFSEIDDDILKEVLNKTAQIETKINNKIDEVEKYLIATHLQLNKIM